MKPWCMAGSMFILVFVLLFALVPTASLSGNAIAAPIPPPSSPTPSPSPSPAPIPSPTPTPGPTPSPTPTPAGTPVPAGTTVELGSVTVGTGLSYNADVQVWVKNVPGPYGLGAYDFRVTFDPAKIRINRVDGGPEPFSGITTSFLGGTKGTNATGMLYFNGYHSSLSGPTGNVLVATINISAITTGTHTLALRIVTLATARGKDIAATAVNSSVLALDLPATPGPTATPTPSPTPTPTRTSTPAGTSVELGTVTVRAGLSYNADVQVWVRNMTNSYGLGSYGLKVTFDPSKIKINSVAGGTVPFNSIRGSNLHNLSGGANNTGNLLFYSCLNTYGESLLGPTGDIHIATVNLSALACGVHTLTLVITSISTSDPTRTGPITATAVSGSVRAFDVPVASFTANKTRGTAPLTVSFTDLSTGNITAWEWDLNGDGGIDSTGNSPVYRYARPGRYSVTLKAANYLGSNTKTVAGYITVERLKVKKVVRTEIDSDGVVTLPIDLGDITDPVTGQKVTINKGIKQFRVELRLGPGGVALIGARQGAENFNEPLLINYPQNEATLSGSSYTPAQHENQTRLAKVVPRLTADKDVPVQIILSLPSIIEGDNDSEMEEEGPTTLTFRRGAARGGTRSDITDALFIAQYLAGVRHILEINPVNAASIHHDGASGDKITIIDALYLAQNLAGLRDNSFNFIH